MKPKLTESDFLRAANRLRCEVSVIKAVAFVESRGAGFYADGFPVILFERHIFRRETKGKYSKTHPHLSGPAGNYGPAGKNQRVKFSQAFALDPEAAMKSCSWGKFQIMGFNHKACGYATVGEFVDAMKESEGKHLDAFVEFVISQRIDRPLREKNWTDFARSYNGKGYAKNKYDIKMANAYAKFLREDLTTSAVASSLTPSETPSEAAVDDVVAATTPTADSQVINVEHVETAQVEPPKPPPQNDPVNQKLVTPSTFTRVMTAITGFIGSVFAGIASWFGGSEIAQRLAEKSGERIVENAERSDLAIFGLVLLYVVGIGGAGVFLFWLATRIWDRSSERANTLNAQLIHAAERTDVNTVEAIK